MKTFAKTAAILLLTSGCTSVAVEPPAKPAALRPAGQLVSVRVDKAPELDGNAADAARRSAPELKLVARRVMEPNIGASTNVSIRSVHTDTDVYVLVAWDDQAQDLSHKSWAWNA